MIQEFGLFVGERKNTLGRITQWHIDRGRNLWALPRTFRDPLTRVPKIEEAIQELDIFPQYSKKKMLGFDRRGSKLACFITGKENDAARSLRVVFEHKSLRKKAYCSTLRAG